ncbi:zinc-dependent alcohol dehydrogenase family protein [Paenibacillus alkalitolerans]|uniref:zinc-dependent alcohol dehydrogenase family protein n=1 Tax=Paenibacillus alkalitolerans TaxID=2799335 RepID=UPI0018F3B377|nr:zinc-dependent alcohol dehydrogenase family protein [Paenibacillus alkalitolerans]
MRALVITEPNKAVVREVPKPQPKPGEVLIRVERAGICGTDIHIYKGEFISPYPIIPGHEFSGVVHEVGEGVIGLHVGDRVTADPTLYCGECEFCMTHRNNHCENWNALGNTVNGCMAEYVAVAARNAVKIPDTMSHEEAAFIEPMACVVHALNRLQVQAGNRILLFGAGAMGQLLVQSLSRSGASQLAVVDISKAKLDMALKYGATEGVLFEELDSYASSHPNGFDIVADATGIPEVIEKAFAFMGPAAKYLQFGVTPEHASVRINPFTLYHKDWTILGSMAINQTFLPAFHWIKAKRMDLTPIVSKVIPLEEMPAFLANPRDPGLMKVQIQL